MFVRLTSLNFLPEHEKEEIKIYKEEIAPIIKKQKGAIDAMLLHPEQERASTFRLLPGIIKKKGMPMKPVDCIRN